jgi:acetylornithine deacetylase/succinyl-diaminopimelate desuccinylase-like protein
VALAPLEPDIRDGRIYARGAADDKGNFLPLLHVACELAREGELPVNVRVLVEGEEEAGSVAVSRWIAEDARGADCALVFDSGMADERTPAITVGLRGVVMVRIEVRTGDRDLHSGIYGGSVLNALHVLHGMLEQVLPGPDGRVREELRAGIEPPASAEVESWARLKRGDEVISEVGGRPVWPEAGREYWERNGADAALDLNEVAGGEPRTLVPATASATLSLRLAPRQDPEEMARVLEQLLRSALPEGAELELSTQKAAPALADPESPPVRLAADALERACGVPAVLMRVGGSIPAVAQLMNRGIPTIVSGFSLPQDAFHAPNESYSLESLRLGEAAVRELYPAMARLPARPR